VRGEELPTPPSRRGHPPTHPDPRDLLPKAQSSIVGGPPWSDRRANFGKTFLQHLAKAPCCGLFFRQHWHLWTSQRAASTRAAVMPMSGTYVTKSGSKAGTQSLPTPMPSACRPTSPRPPAKERLLPSAILCRTHGPPIALWGPTPREGCEGSAELTSHRPVSYTGGSPLLPSSPRSSSLLAPHLVPHTQPPSHLH
jgi:hypothetical protein